MKALDAYRDVLKELDAWSSPAFNIRQFNYFFNRSISDYVAENYARFNVVSKEDDDMSSVVVLNEALTVDPATSTIALPVQYRHILGFNVKTVFIKAVDKYKVDDVRMDYVDRTISAEKGFKSKNAYDQPTWNKIKYEMSQGNVKFSMGSYVKLFTGINVWIDYIKIPPTMYLNPDSGSDYNLPENNTTLFYNTALTANHIYFEIAKLCAKAFAENQRNERLQSMIAMEQMTPK